MAKFNEFQVQGDNPLRPYPCEILAIDRETEKEWTFKVACDEEIKPGQFMQLSLPRVGEAPISVSGASQGQLEFTIRNVGKVTSGLFESQAGDVVFLRGPYGNGWPMDTFQGKNIVIITGGTGLSPTRMLINDILQVHPDHYQDLYLITGFRDHSCILFRKDLESWGHCENIHPIYTLDNEQYQEWNKGFVTEHIQEIPFDSFHGNYAVVVVGPPPMMHFTGLELLKQGAEEDHIWMSFERKMSCAIGKCGNCRINEVYVCQNGPVFPYTQAKYLVD